MARYCSLSLCVLAACCLLGQAQMDGPDLSGELLEVQFSLHLVEPSTTVAVTTMMSTTEAVTTAMPSVPMTTEDGTTVDTADGFMEEELLAVAKRSIVEFPDEDLGGLMVTDSTDYPPELLKDVEAWLTPIFEAEYAYESFEMITTASIQDGHELSPIVYVVKYDLEMLSMAGGLDEEGIVHNLTRVSNYISTSNETFDTYVINEPSTQTSMDQSVDGVSAKLTPGSALCEDLALTCMSKNTSCDLREGSIECADNCVLYDKDVGMQCADPESNHAIIFLEGKCRLTKDGDPYCDCGMSPGDVMKNFYIEPRCVSAAFVVGMAAGLGGFLIIVFVCTVIGVSVCLRKEKDKSQHINAYSDAPKSRNKEELILDDLEKNGTRSANNAYENRAYVPYEEPKDMRQELTDQEYADLRANLSHIDPKVDYTIRRPSLRSSQDHYNPSGLPNGANRA